MTRFVQFKFKMSKQKIHTFNGVEEGELGGLLGHFQVLGQLLPIL
jgi:hypothetical protein